MVTNKMIKDFFSSKRLAIAGVSRNPKKFGHQVFKYLTDKGYDVLPINPNADKINEVACYTDIKSLPGEIENLYIVTPKSKTEALVEEAINKGIKRLWIQQMSETDRAIDLANDANIDLIYHECILMFAEPVKGPHKLHRFIWKIFGKLPK